LTSNQDPSVLIDQQNPWYTDNQFSKQYNRPGPRAVIEKRWVVFKRVLTDFYRSNNKVSISKPIRILDAGCGDGINLFGLGKIVREKGWNASIFGVDYNPLRIARASIFSEIEEIKHSSLDALPYPDEYFDVVLCNQVLEHIHQYKKVVVELKRVLCPGGILIVGVPNEGCFLGWFRNHIVQRSILQTTDHVNFFTKKSIFNLISGAGFFISKIERSGFFLPHSVVYSILSHIKPGRWLLNIVGKAWRSQCAELIVIAVK
jgi:ubiquinone/menaquinone biosynthesis C-methylase UbiE